MAAPATHFDDDWPALGDADAVSERRLLTLKGRAAAAEEKDAAAAPRHHPDDEDIFALHECRLSPGKGGAFKATEDPACCFDEKLSACFQNVPAGSDSIAPVSPIEEDSLLEKDAIWNALTSNYGRVMPVDWKQSRTCSLHIPALSLEQKLREKDVTAEELPDDEELREQLDMHSIIVTCLAEEPIFTAEQVIEEIEEMMQDSDMEAEQNPSQSDLSMTSVDTQRAASSPSFERRVRSLSVAELNERLEETEMSIRSLSDELVQQLALRDELDFEKEVKNSFISALIDVQNRQKEHRELQKKKKKLKGGGGGPLEQGKRTLGSRFSMEGLSSAIQNSFRQTFGSGCREKQYLTTVIPYEKKGHPPSLDDLQILTKILEAMRDDSEKVPSLLTDYILKVLCPT